MLNSQIFHVKFNGIVVPSCLIYISTIYVILISPAQ
jgi:hypothetical protein